MRPGWIILTCTLLFCGLNFCVAQNYSQAARLHWNQARGYAPFNYATPSGIIIDDTTSRPLSSVYMLQEEAGDMSLRFMAANSHNHPSKTYQYIAGDGGKKRVSHPAWGVFIKDVNQDSVVFTVRTEEREDALSSVSTMVVSVRTTGDSSHAARIEKTEGLDVYTGGNYWQLALKDGHMTLSGGNRGMSELLSFPIDLGNIVEVGFTSYPGACLTVSNITLNLESSRTKTYPTDWADSEYLSDYLSASNDEMEGYWTVFDRELEESLLQLGGNYGFAMVKDGEAYLLIYLTGARVNAGAWKPGMIKARLTPDFFPGLYKVEWTDSQGLLLSHDIKAQTGEGNTLTIQFPYQSSSLRLRKIPK